LRQIKRETCRFRDKGAMHPHYLQPLFSPRTVALVGASDRPGSLGHDVFKNLLAGSLQGEVFPINPKHDHVQGQRCYRSLVALDRGVDLAVVATPAAVVPRVLEDAAKAGIHHAVILAAGFGETGAEGRAREEVLRAQARRLGIRLLGPNCLGIMRPSIGLNATFARTGARPGPIALVSQSGAVCTALIDWAWAAGFGFSTVVSVGAAIDLDFGEILDYLLYDHETHSILFYLEGVREPRRFVSALRAAARVKPIVAMKVGRHLSGQRAAVSHTGAMVGNDAVFDAVLRRSGVVRVRTYSELFAAARVLASDRLPAGDRLAIVTNGGGPGVMAADACVDRGVVLATFDEATFAKLNTLLPAHWSHANPADILGDATRERFDGALAAVLADPGVDGVLTLFCPQSLVSAKTVAEALIPRIRDAKKPVLTAWLGEHDVREGRDLIEAAGMPAFSAPESGVAAFGVLADYQRAQRLLLEVPNPITRTVPVQLGEARALFEQVAREGRTLMTEPESKHLLACFSIPTPRTMIAMTARDAADAAMSIGFPVALKILSPDIAHKSDVGGVRLAIRDVATVEAEFTALVDAVKKLRPNARVTGVAVQPMVQKRFGREVSIGVATDSVFGPVISFGAGGVAVELLADYAIGLPPLSIRLAEEIIDRTRIAKLLGAYRHIPAADRAAIVDALLAVSEMVIHCPWLKELDINPLLVDGEGAAALDARVVIDPTRGTADARYSHMAIHPYPSRLEHEAVLADGTRLLVRPIRPEDAQRELAFVEGLSDQSRYLRFFGAQRTLSPKMLARLTQVDYDHELALIAVRPIGEEIVGVARYMPLADGKSCEFAVTVADPLHGKGLGSLLMQRLVEAARDTGYETMIGEILGVNDKMLRLARAIGFTVEPHPQDRSVVEVRLALRAT
jgi:acetyltransferase